MIKQPRRFNRQCLAIASGVAFTLWLAAWGLSVGAADASGVSGAETPAGAPHGGDTGAPSTPYVAAADAVEAGRYLVVIGGCNDCHTPGWDMTDGNVPESEWLTGIPLGWKGPWGTSYARNLRLTAQNMTEDEFAQRVQAGGLPPMPWMNLRAMEPQDLRAIYAFLRYLGPSGDPMPAPLAPGVTPETPYLVMEPVMPTG